MANAESLKERAIARLGSVLRNKWRLDSVLGVGGMATVYAATHRNQARVAIKLMHQEIASEPEVTERFLREGYLANVIEHPGTAKVLDDDISEDGAPFLVMELLEGETVEARWERKGRRLPISETLGVADKALEVLAIAHDKGIVHRDLKPENLFLTSTGELKILDFGIARMRELPTEMHTRTRLGSLLGTPAFMAPEQARGRWDEVDARTDIWALGATMFTLLTGRFVHEGTTLQEQLILAGADRARLIVDLASDLPLSLIELVDRALTFEKEGRWEGARAMQSALRDAARSGDERMTLPIPSVLRGNAIVVEPSIPENATIRSEDTARPVIASTPPPPRKRRTVPVLLAGGVVIGIVLGLVWRTQVPTTVTPEPPAAPAAPPPNAEVSPVPSPPSPPASEPTPPSAPEPTATAAVPSAQPRVVPSGRRKPEPSAKPAVAPPVTPPAAPSTNPFDRRF